MRCALQKEHFEQSHSHFSAVGNLSTYDSRGRKSNEISEERANVLHKRRTATNSKPLTDA